MRIPIRIVAYILVGASLIVVISGCAYSPKRPDNRSSTFVRSILLKGMTEVRASELMKKHGFECLTIDAGDIVAVNNEPSGKESRTTLNGNKCLKFRKEYVEGLVTTVRIVVLSLNDERCIAEVFVSSVYYGP